MPVVVVIAHGDAHAIFEAAGDRGDPGRVRCVLEGPVAPVAEEPVAGLGAGRLLAGPRREQPALDAVHVEPAVAVVVEHGHAPRHRLGQEVLRGPAVVEDEAEPGGFGIIGE